MFWQEYLCQDNTRDLLIAPIKSAAEEDAPNYRFLNTLERDKATHELLRLFYVAVTRAKSHLYLSASIAPKEKSVCPSANTLLAKIWETVKDSAEYDLQSEQRASTDSEQVLYRLPSEFLTFSTISLPGQHSANRPESVSPERYMQQTIGTLIHHYLAVLAD